MSWLCQCGNGSLCGDPPALCPLCGFDLQGYFEQAEAFAEEELQALLWRIEQGGAGLTWAPVRDAQRWLDGDEALRASTNAKDWIDWIEDRFEREGCEVP